MSAWIDSNRVTKRRKRGRKTAYKPAGSIAPQSTAPTKRSRKRKADAIAPPPTPAQPNFVTGTPLRIPYGNKEIALKLGARYGSAGWYAPPGPGRRGSAEIGGTTPCNCLYTSHRTAERGRGAGGRAMRQRCRTAGAGCTAEGRRAPRREIRTRSSMAVTAESVARRRELSALLRSMKLLAKEVSN